MKPDYKIIVDGQDITPTINGRLISLTITDKKGIESDEVNLSIDDSDALLNMPRVGVTLSVSMGFKEKLIDKGTYKVDEISHNGPADTLTIKGRAAAVGSSLKTQKTRSFHQKKLGDILNTIAADNDLTAALDKLLASIRIEHIDQTNESDAHFISRLATDYDALISIKQQHLLLLPIGESKTVSGESIPSITLSRNQGDSHTYTENERNKYTGVKAAWQDIRSGQKVEELAGHKGTVKTLTKIYPTQKEAYNAAAAEQKRLSRGKAQFNITLAIGQPEIIAETPVQVSGYKPQIDAQSWVISQVTHSLNDSGITSALVMENGVG